MNLRMRLILVMLATGFLFTACKREVIIALNEGKDCEALYKYEKKIKMITATSTSGLIKTSEFTYEHNVISGIKVTKNNLSPATFFLYYASGICLPSGYVYSYIENRIIKEYNLNGAFTIENTNVIKRIITPNYSSLFTVDSSTSDLYGYDASNRINSDVPDFRGAMFYDANINISYSTDGNVQTYRKFGGEPETMTTLEVDSHRNPFKQQNHLFYLMKFLPFATFPDAVQDVYHYFSLNNNNPLKVNYVFFGTQYDYTFKYVYSPDGYPTHINVYRAGFSASPHIPDPKELQEQLTITYL